MSRNNSSITRRVVSSLGILGSAQSISLVCSVVRTKCIALWLGTVGVGLNSILVNGSNLVSTLTLLNLRESSVRDIASAAEDQQRWLKCIVVRRWALILGVLGAVLMIVVSPLLSVTAYDGSLRYTRYFMWLAPFVFFTAYAAGETALMQAQGELKSIAKSSIAAALSATVVTIILIYIYGLSAIVAVINIFAFAAAVSAFIWRVRLPQRSEKISFGALWAQGRSFLLLGASMSFSVVLAMLAQYAFAAYINSTGGESDLGIYQSGFTLVSAYVGIIFSAMALEYYPRLSSVVAHHKRSSTIVSYQITFAIALMVPVIVVFISSSNLIVSLLYSSQFEGVLPYVNFAIIGNLFRGVSVCYAYRILAQGDSKAYLLTESSSTVIGLALNIWAYSQWSLLGLGVSYITWYAIYVLITASVCRIRYGLNISRRLPYTLAFAFVVCIAAVWLKYSWGWWMPLCAILPWMLPLSYCLIIRKIPLHNGKSNGMAKTY